MNTPYKPFLSICIPTFNRGEKVFELVKNILKYEGTFIEVVILDNCSTDNTRLLLNTIEDWRLNYVSNYTNIGGFLNPLKVITEANGEYSILCLDKDNIDYKNIPNLIDDLKQDKYVVFGYCALNLVTKSSDIIFETGFPSVLKMAYQSQHPSGYFYKTDIFKNSKTLKEIFTKYFEFGFYFDLINAELSFKGESKIINLPLFYTESRSECAKVPSFTYFKHNQYFEPKMRLLEYSIYMRNACSLKILKSEKIDLIKSLYNRGLLVSTLFYRSILTDSDLCLHHGITPRKVGILELIKIDIFYSYFFLRDTMSISRFRRTLICFQAHLNGGINVLKRIV